MPEQRTWTKRSLTPKRTATKQLICEMLTLSKICVETPGRKADVNRLWTILPDLETELTEDEKQSGTSTTMNSSSEDRELENLSAQIVDGELQAAIDDASDEATTEDNVIGDDNVDEDCDDMGKDMSTSGVENEDGDEEDENPLNDDENLLDDEAVVGNETELNMEAEIRIEEVIVGKKEKKKVKVNRLPLHRLATQDIFEVGNAKMIGIDLPAMRLRAKQHRRRERVA
mgnify:CR=1 FL=1